MNRHRKFELCRRLLAGALVWMIGILPIQSAIAQKQSQKQPQQQPPKKANKSGKIAVVSTDGSRQLEGFDPKNFDMFDQPGGSREILAAPERNRLFDRAGLTPADLAGMDEMDKDMLYMRAKGRKLDELVAKYPRLSRQKLQKLRQLASAPK
jgi:hypothetical protein